MPIRSLPFAARTSGHALDLWSVRESGVYVRDTRIGRAYADELVMAMGHMTNLGLLGQVGKAILHKGNFGGIEAGFCQRLAERLIPPDY